MADIQIRPATLNDAQLIANGNIAMALETENLALDPPTVLAGVRSMFDDSGRGFYLVAEKDGQAVGQLMVTYEWSDWRNGCFWWIQSVYVDPASRRKGVFSSLYNHLKARAEATDGICGLRLYVVDENHRARTTYSALGMKQTHYGLFEVDFSGL